MSKKTELLHFYDNYYNSIKKIEKTDEFPEKFYQAFLSGENEFYQKYISETKVFDEEWITTIESYIPSLNKIVQNPLSSIKVLEELVLVEKARKTTSSSVKHLASHTHLIKEVKDDGMIIPSKVLTSYTDVDYGTYENRFIMTLIDRVFIFVRSRYEIIKNNIESFEKRRFYMKSNFPFNDTSVDLEFNFTLTDKKEDKEIHEFNKKLLKRVEYLNKVVSSLKQSKFMELLKGENRIYPPIMKTNIILKNVDFRNAYLLWLFIDRYNTLAFTSEVEEKDLTFDDNYFDAISRQVLTNYATIIANQELKKKEYETLESKKYTKKSIKIKRQHKDDILVKPIDEEVEDQTLNEYYLKANQEIFKQSVDHHLETSSTYEIGIKRALRDTLNISNALYDSFFELDEEENIFQRLITKVDLNEELAEARRKHLISKMIREVKQVDFNNALRQEKKFLNEIAEFDSLLIKEHNENLKLGKESVFNEEKVEHDRKEALLKKEIVDKQLAENKYLSDQIDNYRKEVNKKINDLQRRLQREYQEEVSEYRKEQRRLYREALRQYRKEHMPKRRVTNERLRKEKLKLDDGFTKRRQELRVESKENLVNSKENVDKHNELILKRDKKRYLEMVAENRENIKELTKVQLEYNTKLKEYQRELREKEKEALKKYEKELYDIRVNEMKELREKYKITNRITNNKLNQELTKLENRYKRDLIRHKENLEKQLEERKKKLLKKQKEDLKNQEEKLKERKEENKKNVLTLEKKQQEYEERTKRLNK